MALILVACSSASDKKTLVPLDISRPIYQKDKGFPSTPVTWPIPGGLTRVRVPDPVTVKEMKKQLELQNLRHKQEMDERDRERNIKQKEFESFWGGVLKISGWCLVALGIACHAATTFPAIKSWGASIITLGAAGVLGGLAIQKTVQADKYLTVAFWLCVGFLIIYKLRNWSISHIGFIAKAKTKIQKRMNDYRTPNSKQ